jgi:hypothetical protein
MLLVGEDFTLKQVGNRARLYFIPHRGLIVSAYSDRPCEGSEHLQRDTASAMAGLPQRMAWKRGASERSARSHLSI